MTEDDKLDDAQAEALGRAYAMARGSFRGETFPFWMRDAWDDQPAEYRTFLFDLIRMTNELTR